MDVVNKVSHFAHAGNDMNLSPNLKNFLGKGEQEVVERALRGEMDSIKDFRAAHSSQPVNEDDEQADCHSQLRCARQESKVLLKYMVQECPSLKNVYIDFGCRLSKTWERHLQDLGENVPATANAVRIMMNWLHASSHDLSCQILNNGRFMEGTGWVVGEQIEQLWSLLKDAAGLMRCMTKQSRRDFLELLLSDINDKFTRVVDLLKNKIESMHTKQCELVAWVANIKASAHESGVTDVEVACAEFPRYQLASTASSGPHLLEQQHEDEVAYVRLREMEDAESKLRSIGYTWKASQGTPPGELLLKGSKHSEMSALSRKLADIEVKLKIEIKWDRESDLYKARFEP
ncbi:hypothetical protein DUNSADRAFT_16713 [Dunaliella salina]|uniref:Uncharacterized protein n=1 Tax=Dunaliella salina TaxID=3046 RepID=A0ABQ7G322_DUNSA|nr:hypothetical protein DUNSADRAFT_16713 [Dunaliella salina]|eukprot:KAF5829011.1 hypothetical protein DUNSADRAFT_16713 [Dunaliella salina]